MNIITYEGLGHSEASLDFAILLIGAFIVSSWYYIWKKAPKTRRFLHDQLHENKPKVEGWLRDPDYYKKKDN